jgi:hypothetical protein
MRGTSHIAICEEYHACHFNPPTNLTTISYHPFLSKQDLFLKLGLLFPTTLQRLKHEYTSLIAIGLYPIIEEFLQLAWQRPEA